MIQNNFFPTVENMLDWAAKRQQALSANIANIDTPGYHSQDISFSEALQTVQMTSTGKGHIALPSESAHMRVYEVDGQVKDNGNTVSLDREMTSLTKNGLQYITMIQYLNQKLRTLRTAISEGGKG